MAMNIYEQLDAPALERFLDHFFEGEDFRRCLHCRVDILSVHVVSAQATSVVAYNDPIRVEHGYNFEHKLLSEQASFCLVAHQEFDDAFHYVGSIALSWVHS